MNTRNIILAIFFLVLAGAVVWGIIGLLQPKTPAAPEGTNPFGTVSSGNNASGGTGTLTITSETGQTYAVPDFTNGHPALGETSGTYYYITQDASGEYEHADFNIVYGSDSSISIGLLEEPIGAARLHAEAELRRFFPLTDAELCSLDTTVMASKDANETYAGYNLGLSFCSGSVKLPS